jgi:glycosyltransferase involved in cell wall biosynthesis
MTPRVLFLNHAGVLGGGELSLLDIAVRYANSSKVLLLADGPFRSKLEQVGVAVEVLPVSGVVSGIRREGNGIRELQAMPEVLKLSWSVARSVRDYDVLYANSQKALVIGALAGKLASKPVIWHLRDMLVADHFSREHRWLAVVLSNHAVARVIANSKATAASFVRGGGRAEKVRLVHNGIDPTPFESVNPTQVDALRRALGLAEVPVVGVFSRLAPWKGQHILLEALARLPHVHAVLVGEAIFGELAYAKALGEQAQTLGIADRVRFLGFRHDIPQLMKLSDVVVHTSIAPEPFGRVVLEGMLARRPVVAARAGGVIEIIEDKVNGILVRPGDTEALAETLADLLAKPTKAGALAEAGYKVASERFSLRAMVEGVAQQLQEIAVQQQ